VNEANASRRGTRDLVPAFLAAGAVGLVVTVVVGGTTAGIDRAVVTDAPVGVAELAEAPVAGGAGISVRVRPAQTRPAPTDPTIDSLTSLTAAPPAAPRALARARSLTPVRPSTGAASTGAVAAVVAAAGAVEPAVAVAAVAEPPAVAAAAEAAPVELIAETTAVELAAAPAPGTELPAATDARHTRLARLVHLGKAQKAPAKFGETDAKDQRKAAKADAKDQRKADKAEAKDERKADRAEGKDRRKAR
jgi:hypothetical protein